MRFLLSLFIFSIFHTSLSAQMNQPDEVIYKMVDRPIVYSSDTLLTILKKHNVSLENCYTANGDSLSKTLGMLSGFEKLYIFDKSGNMYRIVDDKSCISPIFYIQYGDISVYPIDSTRKLNTLLANAVAITSKNIDYSYPSALIYWNLTTGINKDNSPFDLEKALMKKFNFKINIIKINTDVNENFSVEKQKKYLDFYTRVVETLTSRVQFKFEYKK